MNTQRNGITGFGAGVVLALLLAGCNGVQSEPPPPRPAIVVQPRAVQGGMQLFSGEVRARQEAALAFRVGGKVARRLVDVGSRVEQDQLLAELDAADLALQAQAAQAQLAAAQAELALAESEYARYADMRERGLVSASVFEARQAALQAARAQQENARAQLSVMRNQRGYAQLTAPQAGVILARQVEDGQVVAAGQTVFVLAAEGEREVAISVPELQIGQFSVGQAVMVELWSQPGRHWPGTVRELAAAADPQARTFAARVAFQAPDDLVELGQSARVLVSGTQAGVLAVPLAAVGGEQGAAFVWVLDPTTLTAQRREVDINSWGEREALVGDGLTPQDWVVAGGVHLVGQGQRLRPVDHDNRALDLAEAR